METVSKDNPPQAVKNVLADKFQPLSASTPKERERIATPSSNFLQNSWRRLKENKAVVTSANFLAVIIFISTITIRISPCNPTKQNISYINLPPRIFDSESMDGLDGKTTVAGQLADKYAQANIPDNANFYLGIDGLGRDVLSRLFIGTRISLLVAFIAAILDITIGVTCGLTSRLIDSRVDIAMQRTLEALSDIPNLAIMILMLTVSDLEIASIILAMAITNWISTVRTVRTQTTKLKDQEFIMAAEAPGEPRWKIVTKYILPNISGTIIVQTMFSIPSAIFSEASLSFIGLGLRSPTASSGTLLSEEYKTFRSLLYLMWIPVAAPSTIMTCFDLLTDGLRDTFSPKMRE